jgi:hypothetical protein
MKNVLGKMTCSASRGFPQIFPNTIPNTETQNSPKITKLQQNSY